MNNNMEKEIFDIYVDDIIPNRFQPRLTFDETSLRELADSIRQHGIIQPLVVRKIGDKYEIIAGERRYKAAQLAGMQKVPAVIMNLDDKESAEVAVVENIQRRDLSALEEAESYKKLLDKGYLTQEQLAGRMGKAQATISNKLRLLNLPTEVKDALLNGKISERHARSLLSLKNESDQIDILNQIITNKLTVRQTDDLIKSMIGPEPVETLDFNGIPVNNNAPQSTPSMETPINEASVPPIPFMDSIPSTFEPISNIDVNKIKEGAVDINPTPSLADMNTLLGSDIKTETPAPAPKPEVPSFRFISAFDDEDDNVEESKPVQPAENVAPTIPLVDEEPVSPAPLTYTDSLVQEYRNNNGIMPDENAIQAGDLKSAINAVRELSRTLEKNGFVVDIEEFDFEKLYQIIIKINK